MFRKKTCLNENINKLTEQKTGGVVNKKHGRNEDDGKNRENRKMIKTGQMEKHPNLKHEKHSN